MPAGATGLVGSRLAAKLASQGNKVRVVTRNVNSAKSKLQYPGLEFYSLSQIADAVKGSDAVVNLAGEPIGTRWVGRDCAKQLVQITAGCSLCRSSCKKTKHTNSAPAAAAHVSTTLGSPVWCTSAQLAHELHYGPSWGW
jgi:NAD dependent epimerase/dehydratase family enzyme